MPKGGSRQAHYVKTGTKLLHVNGIKKSKMEIQKQAVDTNGGGSETVPSVQKNLTKGRKGPPETQKNSLHITQLGQSFSGTG